MLAYPAGARIFVHTKPVDLRKGFEGLSFIVETILEESLTSGAFFVFLNKQRDKMKILYFDNDGLAIWTKRLEKGLFGKIPDQKVIDRREFFMLLEGITPRRINRRYKPF